MITANQLDLMYGTLINKIKFPIFQTHDETPESGLTTFSTTDDAFILNDPCCWLKQVNCEFTHKDNENGFILRTVVPYNQAIEMGKDYLYGVETLALIKNHMLTKAAKRIQLNRCHIATFARPSVPSCFFRELENSAGFELRLYVQYRDISLEKIG